MFSPSNMFSCCPVLLSNLHMPQDSLVQSLYQHTNMVILTCVGFILTRFILPWFILARFILPWFVLTRIYIGHFQLYIGGSQLYPISLFQCGVYTNIVNIWDIYWAFPVMYIGGSQLQPMRLFCPTSIDTVCNMCLPSKVMIQMH